MLPDSSQDEAANSMNLNNFNSNPNAINILQENKNKIQWLILSGNPNAVELIEENLDKINCLPSCKINNGEPCFN